eukprot:scaffold13930_cov65-Phaeocystis_antarctica.AAC.6
MQHSHVEADGVAVPCAGTWCGGKWKLPFMEDSCGAGWRLWCCPQRRVTGGAWASEELSQRPNPKVLDMSEARS